MSHRCWPMLADRHRLPPPPRAILLRCDEYVPITKSGDASAISTTDIARHLKQLGWEEYGYNMITDVLKIPGDHYSVFALKHVSEPSTQPLLALLLKFLATDCGLVLVAYWDRLIPLQLESNKHAKC